MAPGDFVIGMGSNLGSRSEYLCAGLGALGSLAGVRVVAASSVFETDPIGPPQPRYLNAAARITSTLGAEALLDRLRAIEVSCGRIRRVRWGARTLDLDILWAESPVRAPRLTIPHAHLHERAFALAPLLEVAPELGAHYGPLLAALGGAPARVGRLSLAVHDGQPWVDFQQSVAVLAV